MSHHPERKAKDCLNCGSDIIGKYCHICGQENIEPKESFLGLVKHFFYDITHFDGNFFSSVKYLLFRPGHLSSEYMKGRRASYLHPVRMYVFTSAIFFLIFFSMYHLEQEDIRRSAKDAVKAATKNLPENDRREIDSTLSLGKDSIKIDQARRTDSLLDAVNFQLERRPNLDIDSANLEGKKQYEAEQDSLPANKRDGWLMRKWHYKLIEILNRLQSDPQRIGSMFLAKLFHMLPQILFVSLPLFALILKLLYIRRKQFYYADHAIFSIHLYVFSFILILTILLLSKLQTALHWPWIYLISTLLFLYGVVYSFLAMKWFYRQGALKTFVKYVLLFFLAAFVIVLLFVLFFFLSLFQI